MAGKNLDSFFAETQNILVKSFKNFYRYRKRYKGQVEANGRKQARFHIKDKNLAVGCRRD